MSKMNGWVNWIEEAISKNDHIKYYEYNHFLNIKKIGDNNFGKVYRTNWKNSEQYCILKSFKFDNATVKEIIYEVNKHKNIIKCISL